MSALTSSPRDVASSSKSKKVPLPLGKVASVSRNATQTQREEVADSIVEAI